MSPAQRAEISKVEHYALLILAFAADVVLAVGTAVSDIPAAQAAKWGGILTVGLGLAHGFKETLPATAAALGQPAPDDTAVNDSLQTLGDNLGHQAQAVSELVSHLKSQPAAAAIDTATQEAIRQLAAVHDDAKQLATVVSDARELADPPPATEAPGEVGSDAPAPDPAIAAAQTPTAAAPGPVVASTGTPAPPPAQA